MSVTISGSTGIGGNVAPFLVTGSLSANTSNIGTLTGNLVGNVSGTVIGNLSGTASTAVISTSSLSASVAFAPAPGSQAAIQSCKAWVNFNGADVYTGQLVNAASNLSVTVSAGSSIGTYNVGSAGDSQYIGQVYYIPSIGGATNATLGGVNVSNGGATTFNPNVGFQITGTTANGYTIKLLAGPAISPQTIVGNGAPGGFQLYVTGIRAAYNISNVTRLAKGNYGITFATPMNDVYYAVVGMPRYSSSGLATIIIEDVRVGTRSQSGFFVAGVTSGYEDSITVNLQVFGN